MRGPVREPGPPGPGRLRARRAGRRHRGHHGRHRTRRPGRAPARPLSRRPDRAGDGAGRAGPDQLAHPAQLRARQRSPAAGPRCCAACWPGWTRRPAILRTSFPRDVGRLWDQHLAPQARADGVPDPIIDFLRTRHDEQQPHRAWSPWAGTCWRCQDRTAELADAGRPADAGALRRERRRLAPDVQERMARRLGAQRVCIPGAAPLSRRWRPRRRRPAR